jgi:hypothetical protein
MDTFFRELLVASFAIVIVVFCWWVATAVMPAPVHLKIPKSIAPNISSQLDRWQNSWHVID